MLSWPAQVGHDSIWNEPLALYRENISNMTLSVIGAGLPRTGTSSLKVALEQLGFGPCYHMREVITYPERAQSWIDAADGRPVDWEKVFEGYRSATDAPACHFYKQLTQRYPDAPVILSLRNPESWFSSTQETILTPFVMKMHVAMNTLDMCNKIGWGDAPELRDKDYMLARFHRHNDEVMRTIPKQRLLVFEAKQGWPPLCTFLGVPVPTTPFPHANSREDFAGMTAEQRKAVESMSPEQMRKMMMARLQEATQGDGQDS
jgi:Sulfotransferase domain